MFNVQWSMFNVQCSMAFFRVVCALQPTRLQPAFTLYPEYIAKVRKKQVQTKNCASLTPKKFEMLKCKENVEVQAKSTAYRCTAVP